MSAPDYAAILTATYPGALWTLDGVEYAGLTWQDVSPKPSQAELDAAWPQVQKDVANRAAERNRQAAYQVEADPLFFGWQRGENTQQDWLDKVEEIRARFPYEA